MCSFLWQKFVEHGDFLLVNVDNWTNPYSLIKEAEIISSLKQRFRNMWWLIAILVLIVMFICFRCQLSCGSSGNISSYTRDINVLPCSSVIMEGALTQGTCQWDVSSDTPLFPVAEPTSSSFLKDIVNYDQGDILRYYCTPYYCTLTPTQPNPSGSPHGDITTFGRTEKEPVGCSRTVKDLDYIDCQAWNDWLGLWNRQGVDCEAKLSQLSETCSEYSRCGSRFNCSNYAFPGVGYDTDIYYPPVLDFYEN